MARTTRAVWSATRTAASSNVFTASRRRTVSSRRARRTQQVLLNSRLAWPAPCNPTCDPDCASVRLCECASVRLCDPPDPKTFPFAGEADLWWVHAMIMGEAACSPPMCCDYLPLQVYMPSHWLSSRVSDVQLVPSQPTIRVVMASQ